MRFDTHHVSDWVALLDAQSGIVRCICCSTLVITVTWLSVILAIRKSAAIRHRVFSLGFAGLLIVPVATAITAGWNPMISFSHESETDIAVTSNVSFNSPQDLVPQVPDKSDLQNSSDAMLEPFSQDVAAEPANLLSQGLEPTLAPLATSDATPLTRKSNAVAESRISFPKPQYWIGVIWAVGVILLAVKLALEWCFVRGIVRTGVPVTDKQSVWLLEESRRTIQCLANHSFTHKRASVQILCSSLTPVPIATGILSPKIVLPVGFGKWTNERLRIVLMHELTHIDRHDVLANVLARLACIVYWFNPLVWLAARRMYLERELACDDYLLCLGENAESYAIDLFEIAAALKQRLQTAQLATAMATHSNLKFRVQHMMKANLDRRFISARGSWFTAITAAITLMTLAAFSPSFGIAQADQSKRIAKLNDKAVTLSGKIPGDWFEQLKAMPNLQKLTIRNPELENLKVTQLRDLIGLKEFSAEDFSIDSRLADIVAVNIAQLPRLRSVEFHRTGLTGRGLQALSQSSTSELILDGEELISDADFKHVAMMSSLRSLVLDSTPIDFEGLTALHAARGLRQLALRRHPGGSDSKGTEARVKAITGFENLEKLELSDTGYDQLVALKANKSLRILTLHNGGANDASKSLKQLTQLKQVEIDNCDIRNESFDDVKSNLGKIGIVLADITRPAANLLTRSEASPDEATVLARRALDELDVGKHFPSFWIGWRNHWSKIPTMTAEPIRTVHRLKQALTAENEKQPWGQDTKFAYAPGQFFVRNRATTNDIVTWEQITYGDDKLARSREGQFDKPPMYILRNGVKEFEESLGLRFPRHLSITHQHLWWGIPTHHNITSSPVSPGNVVYIELPEESLLGETCRVLQGPGRSERLWVSKETGRLRGALHYIHQGYFTPFFKQDVVTRIVGRRIESNDDYGKLFSGPGALAKDVQHQLSQAWAEHEFSRAYPGSLCVLDDYREIAPGHWFPFKVISTGWHHNEKDQGTYDFHVSENIVNEIAVDRDDLEHDWAEFLPKKGDNVQDQRYGVAINYQLDNDRTEEDIQDLINKRLLDDARSSVEIENIKGSFKNLIGKPAPRLPEAGWVGERPDLTGKRYLIHFWAAWCGPCKNDVPLLNSVAKSRIVIGVHPGDRTVEQVSQVVKDAKMSYPTIVAPSSSQDLLGYPAKMFPYCVEVDEQGIVAKHGFLDEVLGVKSRDDSAANQSPKASGTVLAMDDKNELAVISLGEIDGVQSNQLIDITREGKSIAQLRVITLHKNRCVGRITDQNEKGTMKIGDTVLSFVTMPTP